MLHTHATFKPFSPRPGARATKAKESEPFSKRRSLLRVTTGSKSELKERKVATIKGRKMKNSTRLRNEEHTARKKFFKSGTSQRKCVGIEMCAAYKNKKQKKAPFEVSEFTLFFLFSPLRRKRGRRKIDRFSSHRDPQSGGLRRKTGTRGVRGT